MNNLSWMQEALDVQASKSLLRQLRHFEWQGSQERHFSLQGRACIDFSSNDYLGLRHHPALVKAAQEATAQYGTSASASRLLSGNHPLYAQLEERLCSLKQGASAIVGGSGYALNIAALPALASEGDVLFLDKLCHASLVDGARASKAQLRVYPHRDCNGLESALKRASHFRRRLIVTDAVFSMDGDLAPLPDLLKLSERYGAELYVDEAHATGIWGEGRGYVAECGLGGRIDYVMGTCSKALGSLGGFIVSPSAAFAPYAINTFRSLIYSTALPPAVVAATLQALAIVSGEEGRERRHRLLHESKRVRGHLAGIGFSVLEGEGPIIPIHVGESQAALALSERLLERGFYVPAVRYPTVPKKGARLRLTLSASHTDHDIALLLAALQEVA